MKKISKNSKRYLLLGALPLLWVFLFCLPVFAANTDNTSNHIFIDNGADLITLSKNCTADTWSRNKTVELTSDIDVSALSFTPIPSFGGTFLGNGHTISGLKITEKGSYQGLFRYIQPSGSIENLTLKGTITPDGTPKYLGGIAGKNEGSIKNCHFEGYLYGKSFIGGIAGFSDKAATITDCTAKGTFLGENYTGGICGQNFGFIKNCQNYANVNTVPLDKKKSLQDLEPDGEIDLTAIRSTENVNANTDTGGIAGYSKGTIEFCKNLGTIGYQHVGYNTGGICGRQAGIISHCENKGEIFGRKDVGGICGQAEPYIVQAYSEDAFQKINQTLRNTQSIMNDTINNTNHKISNALEDVNQGLKDVTNSTQAVSDNAIDYADNLITDTNEVLARISQGLDHMEKGLGQISTASSRIGYGIADFEDAGNAFIDYLKNVAKKAESSLPSPPQAPDQPENSPEDGLSLTQHIESLSSHLQDPSLAAKDIKNIQQDIGILEQQISSTGDILNQEKEMLTLLAEEGYLPQNETTDQLLQQLGITAEEIAAIKNTIAAIKDQLPNVGETIDPIAIQELLKKLQESFQTLDQQLQALKTTLQKTTAIITAMKTQAPTLNKALLYLEDGFQDLEWGMDYLTKGTEEITKAIRVMRQGEPLAIPEIDDEFRGNLDDFHAAIDNLENQFSHLNTTLSDTQDQLVQDMNTINGQFLQIINILSDTYDRNQPGQEEDFIEDVSDENTSGNSLGKITACLNYGKIQADINTGGIVGAMAIEYDFDPEDDVVKQGSSSLRFTYKTKAIIEKCQNQGIITGKKNYIGSIVGKMDLGTVIFCEGYGNTQSTDGSFVGGIAGFSNGFIRSSVAKCTLAGEDFVGGITGQGKTIKNCYTLVNITQAEENKGAIAGIDGEEPQEISQNYFVGDTIGGIDNISYQNRAEATTIEEFSNFVQTTFGHPVAFTLTYLADEEVIATLPFTYKTPIDTSLIPSVPEKPGYYGVWSEYDYELPQFDSFITAEYYHAIEILPSALKREGKAVLLICGDFDDHAQMMIRENAEEDKILGKKIINSYLVEITETTPKSQYTVRYLPQKENCQIIIAYGSGSEPQTLEEITAKPFGRYLEFSVPSSTFTLYEVPADSFLWLYAAIAITLCLFGYLFYKKKKTKINSLQKQEELQEN